MKIVIIGGVAGGASAAARLRRLNEEAEIVILEKGPYISFANCGLPYFIGDVIKSKSDILLQTPKSFHDRFNIDVRVKSEVIKIDRAQKRVLVKAVDDDKTYEENYDKLIISTGSNPRIPKIEGVNIKNVKFLRNVLDAEEIRSNLIGGHVKQCTIIGGGNIGIELAENISLHGIKVTIMEYSDHIIPALDTEMAKILEKHLSDKGINVLLNCNVLKMLEKGNVISIITTCGSFNADMVVISAGVSPNSQLAQQADLSLGEQGCIKVNDCLQTNDSNIYAIGDVIETENYLTKKKNQFALAGPANRQGRIAADQICGINSHYQGTIGSSIIKVFDLAAACTGITEKRAIQEGINVDKVYLYTGAHASYYPNVKNISAKIIFEQETGRILGGQFIGCEGADKKCDVLAVAIKAKMKACDLVGLELSYAPPFSSAKDLINMAGFCIENIITGKVRNYHWDKISKVDFNHAILLDVRTKKEYEDGNVPGSLNIPLDELREHLNELPKTKCIYVHCRSGQRSYIACRILSCHGYDCYNISGGYYMYTVINQS